MIIISNKNIENSVYFPQNIYTNNTDLYKLVLTDRGTNKEYVFDNLDDKHLVQYDYYSFFLNFKDLPEGEYEYKLESYKTKVVVETLTPIETKTSRFINISGIESSSSYQDLAIYEIPVGKDYTFYANGVFGTGYGSNMINYFNSANSWIGGEYNASERFFYNVELHPLDGSVIIKQNIQKTTSDQFWIKSSYTTEDKDYEPVLLSKGIIRLNELEQENIYYNKNNEFITYDKQ